MKGQGGEGRGDDIMYPRRGRYNCDNKFILLYDFIGFFNCFFFFFKFQLIMVPGYTQEEKIAITKRHLLPKQLKVRKLF